MALYVIGDTHFSEGCNKPMDIFGGAWTGYRDKLVSSLSVLQPEDTLVLAGDFSWGMSLQEAYMIREQALRRFTFALYGISE